jgi:hypothetical protein
LLLASTIFVPLVCINGLLAVIEVVVAGLSSITIVFFLQEKATVINKKNEIKKCTFFI